MCVFNNIAQRLRSGLRLSLKVRLGCPYHRRVLTEGVIWHRDDATPRSARLERTELARFISQVCERQFYELEESKKIGNITHSEPPTITNELVNASTGLAFSFALAEKQTCSRDSFSKINVYAHFQ